MGHAVCACSKGRWARSWRPRARQRPSAGSPASDRAGAREVQLAIDREAQLEADRNAPQASFRRVHILPQLPQELATIDVGHGRTALLKASLRLLRHDDSKDAIM